MNLTEYYNLSKRTSNPILNHSEGDSAFVYFSFGLVGECIELFSLYLAETVNRDDVKKEIGDVLWYLAMLMPITGVTEKDLELAIERTRKYPTNTARQIVKSAGQFTERVKKVVFHGHQRDETTFKFLLMEIYCLLCFLITMEGLTLTDVLTTNVEKLKKRYPDGFSTENSISRKDEK